MKKNWKEKITPYLFISPWLIGLLVITGGPLIFSLVMSFFNWSITGTPKFIGLSNYITMFTADAQFYSSLKITLIFTLVFVPLNLIIALFLAMLISQPLRGVGIFRTIFYIPAVVSSVAVAIIWGWIFNSKYGVLNYVLSLIGIDGPQWLLSPSWALVSIVIASAWGVGAMMLIFYTDIKGISNDLYEAASLEGINPFQQFFKITLPIITPSILFNVVTSIITALQQLSLVLLLTDGGPLNSTYFYGLYVYRNAFKHNKMGYAAANSWFMFIIILLLTATIFKSSSAWVFYENEVKSDSKKKKIRGAKK